MNSAPGAHRWAAALAKRALRRSHPCPPAPLPDHAWQELLSELAADGLEGLLISAVADGDFPSTAGQRETLAEREVQLVLHDQALCALTSVISRDLCTAGIDHRLLKGVAVGRLDYPDPLWRPAGDIDMLVTPGDYRAAAAVLDRLGGRVPPLAANAKSVAIVIGSVEVDLHRRIVAGPVGHLAALGWFDGRRDVELDGTPVPALDREHAFLHACLNAVSNEWSLRARPLLDVAVLLQPPLDIAAVRKMAAAWGVSGVIVDALEATHLRYGIDVAPLVSSLAHIEAPQVARICCRLDRQDHRSYSVRLLTEALASDPSWLGRLRYLGGARIPGYRWFGLPLTPHPVAALRSALGRRAMRSSTRTNG